MKNENPNGNYDSNSTAFFRTEKMKMLLAIVKEIDRLKSLKEAELLVIEKNVFTESVDNHLSEIRRIDEEIEILSLRGKGVLKM